MLPERPVLDWYEPFDPHGLFRTSRDADPVQSTATGELTDAEAAMMKVRAWQQTMAGLLQMINEIELGPGVAAERPRDTRSGYQRLPRADRGGLVMDKIGRGRSSGSHERERSQRDGSAGFG